MRPDVASIQEMWGEKDQILAAIEAKTGLDYAFSTGSNTWDGDILYRADRWRILDDGVVTYGWLAGNVVCHARAPEYRRQDVGPMACIRSLV